MRVLPTGGALHWCVRLLAIALLCGTTRPVESWSLLGWQPAAPGTSPTIGAFLEDDISAALYRNVSGSGDSAEGIFFMSVGDWGRRNPDSAAVALQMRRWAHSQPPAFIISTGDNFYERGLRGADDPRFTTVYRDLFFREGLQTRWYSSFGQHDLRGNASAQLHLTNRSGGGWFLPHPFYTSRLLTIDSKGTTAQLFVLNPFDNNFDTVQLPWLQHTLNASAADWKLLVAHRPAFTSGGSCVPHPEDSPFRDRIHALMQRFRAQAYFCGDNHFLEILDVDQQSYFVSGGGCGSLTYVPLPRSPHSQFAAPKCGFMAHHLSERALRTTVVDSEGIAILQHSVPRHFPRICPPGGHCQHAASAPPRKPKGKAPQCHKHLGGSGRRKDWDSVPH